MNIVLIIVIVLVLIYLWKPRDSFRGFSPNLDPYMTRPIDFNPYSERLYAFQNWDPREGEFIKKMGLGI